MRISAGYQLATNYDLTVYVRAYRSRTWLDNRRNNGFDNTRLTIQNTFRKSPYNITFSTKVSVDVKARDRSRTDNLIITNDVLRQLSYAG